MNVVQSFRLGVQKTRQSKRMIFFAWLLNVLVTLVVVLPLLSRLEKSIGPTVMEEHLLREMDVNWFQTFKYNNSENEIVQLLDYTIFGSAPLIHHYDSYLSGSVVQKVGGFLLDLVFRFTISHEQLDPLSLLSILYVLTATFLAAGFVGMYARDYGLSFREFLLEGAKYFGRFFRLSLLSLIFYLLVFWLLLDPWSSAIPGWTAQEASEMTAFIHFMIRNGAAILLLGLITLCFDYAKIRIVTEERMSALFAAWAGARFVFSNFPSTVGLYSLLTLMNIGVFAVFAFLQQFVTPSGYWSIFLLFLLFQATLLGRFWVKALFYSSQTQLARSRLLVPSLADLLRT